MSGGALAPGLARKVKKILDIKADDPDLLASLVVLSDFYTENDAAARRKLRPQIESRSLSINTDFLQAAEVVIASLDAVESDVQRLSSCCKNISAALASSQASTSALLADTQRIQAELATSQHRSGLVDTFLQQYQLSPASISTIQEALIGDAFFEALDRVRLIHSNCRSLLRTHHQRAGLELMDSMAMYQETAYERLCRWVQLECRSLADSDAPEVPPLLHRAARTLRDRPILFKYCADEVAGARHNSLFQRFISALTRGGPNGRPRPIEMHAHDPRRYVADMLAWVHQAIASERELLTSLFGLEGEGEAAGAPPPSPRTPVSPSAAADVPPPATLLDKVFESICRPLKVRVQQVLLSSPPVLLAFQLSQLLGFYHGLVADIMSPEASLAATLSECRDVAVRVFSEQLKLKGDRLLRAPPLPPPDCSPPQQVVAAVGELLQLLDDYESSLGGRGHAAIGAASQDLIDRILSASLDPLIELCEAGGQALAAGSSRLDDGVTEPGAGPIFLINCWGMMQAALVVRPSSAACAARLGERVRQQVCELVAGEERRLLEAAGMREVAAEMRAYRSGARGGVSQMAADPRLGAERVQGALRALFQLVSSADALPEFEKLQMPKTRSEAVTQLADALAEAYQLAYECLRDEGCGYDPGAGAAIKHTPAQVATILGVRDGAGM